MELIDIPVPPGTLCQALNQNLAQCPNLATYADDYYGDPSIYHQDGRRQPDCVLVYLCDEHKELEYAADYVDD